MLGDWQRTVRRPLESAGVRHLVHEPQPGIEPTGNDRALATDIACRNPASMAQQIATTRKAGRYILDEAV